MPEPVTALQIVPNEHPPFRDLCASYEAALGSLGVVATTVCLSAPFDDPVPGRIYLGLERTDDTRGAARKLEAAMASGSPMLAICHRYRAYRIFRASRVSCPRTVVIAHEFGFFKRLRRRLERRLFARNVLFAGVSPAVQADLAQEVSVPLCLPNVLDLSGLEDRMLNREEALARLGVSDDGTFTIGLVGRLVEKKRPWLAIEAVRHAARHGGVRLLVIGDGPLRQPLEEQAKDLPVVFCGFVEEARCYYRGLDALLLTSSEVEAFGMVALEAMVAGVPVVSGPMPGPQFVLGGVGYYYGSDDPEAIARALDEVRRDRDTGEGADRLARGTDRALREFSIAALARHLDDLFFRTG